MPESVFAFNKTEKAGTTSKEVKAAVKANHQAMAYLALALKPMELLHLLTRAVTTEWPEGEAWKVMKQVQDIYQPNEMIGVIFTIAPEKYRATLNVTVENHEPT